MNLLSYIGFRIVVAIVTILPFKIIYIFSDTLAFFLRIILKYRSEVIAINLKHCFPKLSSIEQQKLTKEIYLNLSDIILETIAGFGKSSKTIANRFQIEDKDLYQKYYDQNKNIIVFCSHINNWEWVNIAVPIKLPFQFFAMVKPLSNPYIHKYITEKRSKTGGQSLSIYDYNRVLWNRDAPTKLFGFTADQYPADQDNAITVKFFDQQTKFLQGGEKLARKLNYPVLFSHYKRIKRGHYVAVTTLLSAQPKETKPGEITQQFASIIEETIKENPASWLWSHKRWKGELNY